MKKWIGLVGTVTFMFITAGLAWSHSDWAKYQFIPVPDYVIIPAKYLICDVDEPTYCIVDCCGCHWNTNHAGPGKGFCDDK